MRHTIQTKNRQAGFSLVELLVAMLVMMVITGAATSLLVGAFNVRSREDQRSEAIADARRALNIITRELSNSGYRLPNGLSYTSAAGSNLVPVNGLIPGDCDATSLSFVSNLDGSSSVSEADEATKYQFVQTGGNSFLVRNDLNPPNGSLVLANRIDGMRFVYFDPNGNDVSANVAQATRVQINVWVTINPVGKAGSTGYQPASQVRLSSDVNLRNATLLTF
ncbi:MAG TPA: prepilin-type N-terminal cleavage/methylation domain-containing protein [Pyrinomonadaceae bacterium]